jgi:hypothetical protein
LQTEGSKTISKYRYIDGERGRMSRSKTTKGKGGAERKMFATDPLADEARQR